MRIRREGDFAVQDVLRCLAAKEFAGNQLNVFRRTNAGGNGDVDFDEMREVRKPIPFAQALDSGRGQGNAVSPRQLQQRFRLNRAFQVNVKFDLRHATDESVQMHGVQRLLLSRSRPKASGVW